jgi:putative PIN family toxin of toxin-antitoxin system
VRVVLDTNVLVSALLNPHGTPAKVVNLVLSGAVTALFDDRILAEYEDVLTRPRLRITPLEAAFLLEFIETEGVLVSAPPLLLDLPDPDDLPFVEVAAGAVADALVTGNTRHFTPAAAAIGGPILSPAEFIDLWRTRSA